MGWAGLVGALFACRSGRHFAGGLLEFIFSFSFFISLASGGKSGAKLAPGRLLRGQIKGRDARGARRGWPRAMRTIGPLGKLIVQPGRQRPDRRAVRPIRRAVGSNQAQIKLDQRLGRARASACRDTKSIRQQRQRRLRRLRRRTQTKAMERTHLAR